MTMTVPDDLPDLTTGTGRSPATGGCLMQVITWLDSGQWHDHPDCVHPVLRSLGIRVNDNVSRPARRRLWLLVPRLTGTAIADPAASRGVSIALAAWAAETVLPLIKDTGRHEIAAGRIQRARAWLQDGTKPAAAAAAWAAAAADAAAWAAADAAKDEAMIKFLTDMIGEYDRVTGRQAVAVIPAADWERLRLVLGTR